MNNDSGNSDTSENSHGSIPAHRNETNNKTGPLCNSFAGQKERPPAMNLRNLVPAAVFILSLNTAFAVAAPTGGDASIEPVYSFDGATEPDGTEFQNTAGNNAMTVTLLQYADDTEPESEWTFYATGYGNDGTKIIFHEALTLENAQTSDSISGRELSEAEKAALPISRKLRDDDVLHAYEFTISFDDGLLEKIGFIGHNDSDDVLISTTVNPNESKNSLSQDKGTNSILFFDKDAYNNGQIKTQIISKGFFDDSKEEESFSSSVTLPIVLPLIAFCIAGILIMHTVSGKDSA